jgi:1-acyl-sn-glycerol-3-phosphate acyltransferase
MRRLRGLFIADPAVIFLTTFFGSLSVIGAMFDKTGVRISRLARIWARLLLWSCGVRVRVEGLEHIDPNGSYIFVSNHLSYMDTPVVISYVPVQFRFLAKRGLFQIPLLGTHLKQAGHIPVPREDPRAAVKTMQVAADTIVSKKISLLIFPEGGRSHDGKLRPFKEGAAYIAIKAGVPLVPIALIGTREILPFGSAVVLAGEVTLRIMPPIDTAALTLKDRGRVTDEIRELVLKQLDGRATEVSSSHALP